MNRLIEMVSKLSFRVIVDDNWGTILLRRSLLVFTRNFSVACLAIDSADALGTGYSREFLD